MITHDSRFEELAAAPVKGEPSFIVVRQELVNTGTEEAPAMEYVDATPKWEGSTILMEIKIDAVGSMLGQATKKAVVKMQGIQDTTASGDLFQIRSGLLDPLTSDYNYISQGFFIVDTIDYDYEKGSTTVTMYDHMWRAGQLGYAENVPSASIEYPITVEQFAHEMALIINTELMADFDQLPNSQFEIPQDLYTAQSGTTIQNAIMDIAGATGTTARITDTTLTFSAYDVSSENLGSDTLKTLKIGDTYGPVTSVILGRTPQNDNIAISAANPTVDIVENVNTSTDVITITDNGMITGNMVRFASTGDLPAPLVENTGYYVNVVSGDDTFKLAPTYDDAIAGTNLINLTTTGSGAISIVNVPTKEIRINNNQILDDNRQELLPPLYNVLSDIDWTEVQADTTGLGWHEVGDVIQFTQGDRTVRAFLSEIHLVLAGSVKEQVTSEAPEVASIDYQAAGGITKTLYNTEIKVDKQAQDITSIVSRQTSLEQQTLEDFTEIYQNIDNILLAVQKSGGGNLLLNSVGFAMESGVDADNATFDKLLFWDYEPTYKIATNGLITTYTSSESQNAGGISGQVLEFNGDGIIIEQRIGVAVNTAMSFGVRVKSGLGDGGGTITLYNDVDTFSVWVEDLTAYAWQELVIEDFVTSMPWLRVKIETDNAVQLQITDLRILYGTTPQSWVQSNAEILSTNVQFSKLGMKIFDNVHDTETQVTYNEFSTRRRSDGKVLFEADDAGVVANDVSIKGSTNYMKDDTIIIKQITVTGDRAGVAFIKAS